METITGFVDHIVFQNSENGYTVMILSTEGEEMTCVGMCKGLTQGENISAEGEYIEHPVYGRQFKIQSYETVTPTDRVGMERYLGSGAIRGVGEALAARIVKKFGDDTFRIIEEEPERLAEVKGISERKAQEIAIQMEEKKDLREALVYLQQYGISNTLAVKIYNTYGMEMYSVMRENPYRLAEDVSGVGFRIADEIAGKIGIHTDSDYRILDDRVEALEFTVHEESRATGVPLSQLHLKKNMLLCCITRGDNILIPRGGDQIQVGDNVIVVTLEHGLHDLRDIVEE